MLIRPATYIKYHSALPEHRSQLPNEGGMTVMAVKNKDLFLSLCLEQWGMKTSRSTQVPLEEALKLLAVDLPFRKRADIIPMGHSSYSSGQGLGTHI